MQPMVGRADLLRAIAAGVDPDAAAKACGFERREADELSDNEKRIAILGVLKDAGRLDVAADVMMEFNETNANRRADRPRPSDPTLADEYDGMDTNNT